MVVNLILLCGISSFSAYHILVVVEDLARGANCCKPKVRAPCASRQYHTWYNFTIHCFRLVYEGLRDFGADEWGEKVTITGVAFTAPMKYNLG